MPKPPGAILMFIMLIMGGVSIAATAILARGSVDALVDAHEQQAAWVVRAAVFGCLDEALIQLQADNDYSPATLTTGDDTCTLAVSTPQAGERLVVVALTDGDVTRSVRATVTLSPFAVTQVAEP